MQAHVTTYFKNVKGGSLFDATVANAVALDYSLQLQTAFVRLCRVCQQGALTGRTPQLCRQVPSLNFGANCRTPPPGGVRITPQMSAEPLPRQ